MFFYIIFNNSNLKFSSKNILETTSINNSYTKYKYDSNDISIQDIDYIQKFIKNDIGPYKQQNLDQYNILMNQVCLNDISTNCLYSNDLVTNNKIVTCSKIFSNDPEAKNCYQWYVDTAKVNASIDKDLINYCKKFNTSDCACINRQNDSLYKTITKPPSRDDCWYRPCVQNDYYLVPFETRSSVACPNVCSNTVFIVATNSDVVIKNLTTYINCPATDPKKIPTVQKLKPKPDPKPFNYTYLWVGLGLGLFIIVILLIIYFTRRYRNRNLKKISM